jgi:hypothetical protein
MARLTATLLIQRASEMEISKATLSTAEVI